MNSSDPSIYCLTETELRLSGSNLEYLLYRYLFPPICIAGLFGNAANLLVLTSRGNRVSRASSLLACIAVSDCIFLFLLIPHSMASFDFFAFDSSFREIYFRSKIHLIGIVNWISAIAMWLVVVVSFERVIGVRSPLTLSSHGFLPRLPITIAAIISYTATLTFYQHLAYRCKTKLLCHDTQLVHLCLDVDSDIWPANRTNPTSEGLRKFVRWTRMAHATGSILLPLALLIVLNSMLLYYVKRRSFFHSNLSKKVMRRIRVNREQGNSDPLFRRHSESANQQRTEHRIAVTVCSIVSLFTITHGPSAVMLSLNALFPVLFSHSSRKHSMESPFWYNIQMITSFLVIIGKSLNLVVFCLSSRNFRMRLLSKLSSTFDVRERQRSLRSLRSSISRRVSLKKTVCSM